MGSWLERSNLYSPRRDRRRVDAEEDPVGSRVYCARRRSDVDAGSLAPTRVRDPTERLSFKLRPGPLTRATLNIEHPLSNLAWWSLSGAIFDGHPVI